MTSRWTFVIIPILAIAMSVHLHRLTPESWPFGQLLCRQVASLWDISDSTTLRVFGSNNISSTQYLNDNALHIDLVNKMNRRLANDASNNNNGSRYFEGWYYKMDLADYGTFVVIPGLYLRKDDVHGFVMVLDATQRTANPTCRYYKFPIKNMSMLSDPVVDNNNNKNDFIFRLDETNVFTSNGFNINLQAQNGNPSIVGYATWEPLPLHGTLMNPTIMGWFAWLPHAAKQCNHGVVSVHHVVREGKVTIGNNTAIDLVNSQGYVEKDWGTEFPERYTWIQANDFHAQTENGTTKIHGASFMVSVASIPVKPFGCNWKEFTGFLSFLRFPHTDGTFRTIRFATYTGASALYTYDINIEPKQDDDDDKSKRRMHKVIVKLESSQYTLTATALGYRDTAATLWGPKPNNPSGGMVPYVREMLNVQVHLILTRRRDGVTVFNATALHGGFEIEGHDDAL